MTFVGELQREHSSPNSNKERYGDNEPIEEHVKHWVHPPLSGMPRQGFCALPAV